MPRYSLHTTPSAGELQIQITELDRRVVLQLDNLAVRVFEQLASHEKSADATWQSYRAEIDRLEQQLAAAQLRQESEAGRERGHADRVFSDRANFALTIAAVSVVVTIAAVLLTLLFD